jgi:hypothetical protein
MPFRSRERILTNLESIYREAYDRAKAADDRMRMQELDWSYQREQLMLEVLLDVRDAVSSAKDVAPTGSALDKINQIRRLTRR